ncbi:MAG: toxin-antitoxin system YwqK family antitoxin [Flavobacteriales bacterium]|nr:toxin-antitoxin system YwqK family antitoxin [Flavobacteriales bacterium]
MFRLLSVVFILMPFYLISQTRIADGVKKFYYESGAVSSEGLIKNGKPEGYWFNYYENGLIKSEGNRKNHLLDSTWIFYNEKGNFLTKINYKEGLKEGLKIQYSDSCHVILEEYFEKDIKQGLTIHYYDTIGKLKWKEQPFVDGMEEGTGFEYAQDGRIITLLFYKKGTFIGKESINRKDKQNLKQGLWKSFHANGKTKVESTYKNDLLNGYYKEYDAKGKLLNAVLYINGVAQTFADELSAVDIKKEYYANGQLKKEAIYDANGKEHGISKFYDENGNLIGSEHYFHGILLAKGLIDEMERRQGPWEEYYYDGQLKSKGKYLDGKKIDEWEYYFNNGKLEQKGKYLAEEKFTGLWQWYYPNGQLLRSENFRKGLEDGFMEEYDENGVLITKGEYFDGLKEGEWFYELGDHKELGIYKNNERDGLWKFYYPTNKLNFEGKFVEGIADGKHLYYYENGKLKKEEYYLMGIKTGSWRSYNELGELIVTINFKNGEEYKLDGTKLN